MLARLGDTAVIASWIVTGIIVSLLHDARTVASGPGESNVACTAYEWTYNSLHQSPCLVASYLLSDCSASVVSVPMGYCGYAATPSIVGLAGPCLCNLVTYNLLMACSACQNCSVPSSLSPWQGWLGGCANTSIDYNGYPQPIPPGTSVPAWAYLPPADNDYWDANNAQQDIGAPESTPGSQSTSSRASSTTSSATTTTNSSTSLSTAATRSASTTLDTASSSTSTNSAGDASFSAKERKIAGGVVGGLVGIAAIAGVIFILRRRRSRHAPVSPMVRGVTPSLPPLAKKFYDPADPSTYPPPMGEFEEFNPTVLMGVDRSTHPGVPEV